MLYPEFCCPECCQYGLSLATRCVTKNTSAIGNGFLSKADLLMSLAIACNKGFEKKRESRWWQES